MGTPKFNAFVAAIGAKGLQGRKTNNGHEFPSKIQINNMISECELFVFTPPKERRIFDVSDPRPGHESFPASPFRTIHVEIAGYELAYIPVKPISHILSMVIHERSPDVYEYFTLALFENGLMAAGYILDEAKTNPEEDLHVKYTRNLVLELLSRIHRETEGVEPVNKHMRLGKGRSSPRRIIRRIIHISPKRYQSSVTPIRPGRIIDWSHSWLVRGFWRKVKTVGKNRAGEYCVDGLTFVIPHKKGKGKLIHKTRVVSDMDNNKGGEKNGS